MLPPNLAQSAFFAVSYPTVSQKKLSPRRSKSQILFQPVNPFAVFNLQTRYSHFNFQLQHLYKINEKVASFKKQEFQQWGVGANIGDKGKYEAHTITKESMATLKSNSSMPTQ